MPAKWNGSAWSPLGTGADGWINSITLDPAKNPYFGGDFQFIDGV